MVHTLSQLYRYKLYNGPFRGDLDRLEVMKLDLVDLLGGPRLAPIVGGAYLADTRERSRNFNVVGALLRHVHLDFTHGVAAEPPG